MSFALSVASSLVAGVLLLAAAALLSRTARWVLTAALGRLLDIDVDYVFPTQAEAADEVSADIHGAEFVYLMTGRGNELQRDTFSELLKDRPDKSDRVFRILLPDPHIVTGTDWMAIREAEIATFDPAYAAGVLRKQVETNLEFLRKPVQDKCVEVRVFNGAHIGRVVLTDRSAFFTPYRKNEHGRKSTCIKYRAGGVMYQFLLRYFGQTWGAGKVYP